MESHTKSIELPFGAAKLCQDMSILVNNRQCSDIQFKVGGGTYTQRNKENINDESETVTLYAHSLILRYRSSYFATMLNEENNWKESLKGVIYKPNISPNTFHDVLYYIYTGSLRAQTPENIMELIAAADEMDLEELSVECQNELIRTIKYVFSDKNEESTKQNITIDAAIHTYIIPALEFANSHFLSYLFQELLTIVISNMTIITKSPNAYNVFINEISSEIFVKIITSDDLAMEERNVWDLTLTWACHRTNLSKSSIETHFSSDLNDNVVTENDDGNEKSSERVSISNTQLEQFKKTLAPLLPAIRFSLLSSNYYKNIQNILAYMLPQPRFLEINSFFLDTNGTRLLDKSRKILGKKIYSKIVVESTIWELLRKNIFETRGIVGCHSVNDLKFQLLFRASEHGFLASTFHQRCDNKGPTLVIVRSADGHLFGGVNFNHWKSDNVRSSSNSNFLFSLPDGLHRKDSAIFRIKETQTLYASGNDPEWGPIFGYDLIIVNSSNTNQKSFGMLPGCYNGNGASNTTLAGAKTFTISDYEVFAISK